MSNYSKESCHVVNNLVILSFSLTILSTLKS
jgi:hypothetical protein